MHRTNAQKRYDYRLAKERRQAEFDAVAERACARVLSLGAGVQSTACLLKYADEYDYCVFADPGAEWPETYEHIEKRIKPFCAERGIKFITVKSHRGTLEDHCRTQKVIPTRLRRWCTTDWKIRPMQKWYLSIGATAEHPVIVDLGISIDEYWRASRPERVAYEWRHYPLADNDITRAACEQIIDAHGWPRTMKSACDFCPYVKPKEFRRLMADRPDRFRQVVDLEENGKDFPKTVLSNKNKPLRLMLENERVHGDDDDIDAEDHSCTSGFCFT